MLSTIECINLEESLPGTAPFRYIFLCAFFAMALCIFFVHVFGASFAYLKL